MTPKIKRSELTNFRQKILMYNQTINPQTKQGDPALLLSILRYENILLHRHRVKPANEYRINPQDGSIEKRQPIQEPAKI